MHDVDLPQQVDRAKTPTTNIQPGDINNESEPEGGRGGVGNRGGFAAVVSQNDTLPPRGW